MSLQTLINEARAEGRFQGDELVIWEGGPGAVRWTIEWDRGMQCFRGLAGDQSRTVTALAGTRVDAGERALNRYLEAVNVDNGHESALYSVKVLA